MSEYSIQIPNFIGGVSQQPDDLRLPNQVAEAVNVMFSPVEGATKRPPTRHVAQAATTELEGYALFTLDRDDGQYLVLVGDEDIKVFTTAGVAVPVKDSSNSGGSYAPDFTYIENVIRDDVRAVTIADTLFVSSKLVTVADTTGVTYPSWHDDGEAGFFVRQTNYAVKYTVTLKTTGMGSAETVEFTTPSAQSYDDYTKSATAPAAATTVFDIGVPFNTKYDIKFTGNNIDARNLNNWVEGPGEQQMTYMGATAFNGSLTLGWEVNPVIYSRALQTSYVATQLRTAINALGVSGLTVEGTDADSSVRVSCSDVFETWEVKDSVGNTYITGWNGQISRLSDLPTVWKNGAVVKINNNTNDSRDDYYVKFVTEKTDSTAFGKGRWQEWALPITNKGALDADTMPHTLRRAVDDGSGTITGTPNAVYFDWQPWTWDQRQAGDDESNPAPSFVGREITDMVFWNNRLGFLAGPYIVFSETGNQSNFWRTTVISVPPSDRIDVASTEDEGSSLVHAVPMDTRLFLFSRQSQIVFSGSSPQTVEMPVVSKFITSESVQPTLIGRSLFSGFPTASYTGIREFLPSTDSLQFGDVDVSAAVPKYITKGEAKLVGVEGLLLYHAANDSSTIFTYRYFRTGQELLVAAWGEWVFDKEVVDIAVLDDTLYMVILAGGRTYIEKIPIGPGQVDPNSGITIHVDRRVDNTQCSVGFYDVANDRTPITLPYKLDTGDTIAVVIRATGAGEEVGGSLQIDSLNIGASTVYVQGDHTATPFWAGQPYTMTIRMNRPVVQVDRGRGRSTISSGVTSIRSLSVLLNDTGYVEAVVTNRGGTSYTYPYVGHGLGVLGAGLESNDFETSLPVRDATLFINCPGQPQDVSVVLQNSSPLPSNLVSGEWHLRHLRRTQIS